MKILLRIFLFYLLVICYPASAAVTPLVITSQFKNDSWFPLPIEQMESAAVDSALSRLSEIGYFAFLYQPTAELAKPAGTLDLTVTLVEPAESAKITIRLNLPDKQGSYVSSSSVSLSKMTHQGIFNALQQLGNDGATQLTETLQSVLPERPLDKQQQAIRDQIMALNLSIIKLNTSIGGMQQGARNQDQHNTAIMQKLGDLDTLAKRIDAQHEYIKQSNLQQNRKLDAIHAEITKLNIGSNTNNRPPASETLTDYDITRLELLTKARKLKFDKKFNESRLLLGKVSNDASISPVLRKAVTEELHINLPLYEAEIATNEVMTSFNINHQNGEYKSRLKYITGLYDSVLAQPDLSFKKRSEINQKKDQLNLTSDSMDTVATVMQTASLRTLSMSLRNAIAKHYVSLAMGFGESGDGPCPNRKTINSALRQSRISHPVLAYNTLENSCELILEESRDQLVVFVFNEEESDYSRRSR